LAAGCVFAFGGGFAPLGFGAGFLAAIFFFAGFDFAFGRAAGFLAFGRATFFGVAFLRTGFAGLRDFAPAGLRAGLRGFAFADVLRAGFAGFLAMIILGNAVPYAPMSGQTGKPQILSCR
jgi:hypothetical protein